MPHQQQFYFHINKKMTDGRFHPLRLLMLRVLLSTHYATKKRFEFNFATVTTKF